MIYCYRSNFCINRQSLKNNDFIGAMAALTRTAMYLPIFLLTCDHGEMVTTAMGDLDGPFYEIAWHLCPIKEQKYFVPILMAMQEPVLIKGLFSLDCSRDTFKRVNFYYLLDNDAIGIRLTQFLSIFRC